MSGAATIQSKNVAAVAAVAAAAAVAGLASPAATHHMKKLRVLSKKTALFLSLFLFFLSSHLFFPMSMPALNSFSSKGGSMIFFLFFAGHFLERLWGICSICFCTLLCIYFQVLESNFTKNPFCCFRISSLISQSPKNQIICQSVQKRLPNSSVL